MPPGWKNMITINRGDIVLVRFPMPDLQQYKPRPVLVIQNDENNIKLKNTIMLQITTNISNKNLPTQYYIDINTDIGKQSGLFDNSVVKAEVIFTLPKDYIYKKLGFLPSNEIEKIENCLKISLSLK